MFKVTKVEPYENETIQEATERTLNELDENGMTEWTDIFVYNGDVNIASLVYPEEVLGGGDNWHLFDEVALADLADHEDEEEL